MLRSRAKSRNLLPIFVLAIAGLLPFDASAQQPTKYEFSAGYAYMRADSSAGPLHLHGLNLSLARHLNNWLAIVGDGGGYHLEGFRLGTLQAGPRLTARLPRGVSLFTQSLAGFAHANAGARGFPSYHESVAWTLGGGVDWRFANRFSVRLAETELLQTRLGSGVQQNVRIGAGLVIHFGADH